MPQISVFFIFFTANVSGSSSAELKSIQSKQINKERDKLKPLEEPHFFCFS